MKQIIRVGLLAVFGLFLFNLQMEAQEAASTDELAQDEVMDVAASAMDEIELSYPQLADIPDRGENLFSAFVDLREELKSHLKDLASIEYRIKQIEIVAKSRDGNAKVNLEIGGRPQAYQKIPKGPGKFSSKEMKSFPREPFILVNQDQSFDLDEPVYLYFYGNLKVSRLKVSIEFSRPDSQSSGSNLAESEPGDLSFSTPVEPNIPVDNPVLAELPPLPVERHEPNEESAFDDSSLEPMDPFQESGQDLDLGHDVPEGSQPVTAQFFARSTETPFIDKITEVVIYGLSGELEVLGVQVLMADGQEVSMMKRSRVLKGGDESHRADEWRFELGQIATVTEVRVTVIPRENGERRSENNAFGVKLYRLGGLSR